jgi:hypothetical protein
VTVWLLHRAMRVGVALVKSAETKVSYRELPLEPDREQLRKMRNAIDHDDEPIIRGRAGKGEALSLEAGSTQMSIADEDGVAQTVTYEQFASWIETLHKLAWELIQHPHSWATQSP